MTLKATGVFPANVTARSADGQIDLPQTKMVVDFLFSKGVDGLHVCGTTGEFASLSIEQRKAVAEACVEAANGRGTIMIHVGAVATGDSCQLAKHAAQIGADVISSVPPFYYRLDRPCVINHYQRIADATDLPLIIYDNPSVTGFTVTDDIARELAEKDKVHGIKLARHDMYALARMADIRGGEFVIYPVETLYLAGLVTAPMAGTIGSMGNWIPEAFVGIKRNFQAGNLKRAAWLQRLVCALIEVYMDCEIQATKLLLAHRGLPCGDTWEPLVPLSKHRRQEILDRIHAFELDYDALADLSED